MNRCVCVELGNPRRGDLVSWLSDVLRSEEELRREVGDSYRCWVVEGQALDASEGDVLGYLDTETFESHDKHVGSAHALHGLVSQYIELATVERLIDFSVADHGLVDLHPGHEVNLGELLVLLLQKASHVSIFGRE